MYKLYSRDWRYSEYPLRSQYDNIFNVLGILLC